MLRLYMTQDEFESLCLEAQVDSYSYYCFVYSSSLLFMDLRLELSLSVWYFPLL